MPSGKVHDAVTFLIVGPVMAAAWKITGNAAIASTASICFLIGGLMFGPDLDTLSKQYSRWGFLRFLWYPYRAFFKHRSRWSHGLIFGTLLRVVYLVGSITLTIFVIAHFYESYRGGSLPNLLDFAKTWGTMIGYVRANEGEYVLPAVLIGLWMGAASHTLTDMAGSFIKNGRIMDFL